LTGIGALKNGEKGLRPFGHRSVELGLGFCFQQSSMGGGVAGWGTSAEGRKRSGDPEIGTSGDRKTKTAQLHANLDDLGWSGMNRDGVGIAVIARNRRNRKSKTSAVTQTRPTSAGLTRLTG